MFLFLYFFWGKEGDQWNWNIFLKSEVNHTEIFHSQNAVTLQGTVKQESLIKSSNSGFQGRAVKLQGWKSLSKSPCIPLSLRGGAPPRLPPCSHGGNSQKNKALFSPVMQSVHGFVLFMVSFKIILKLGGGNSKVFYVHSLFPGRFPFWRAYYSKGFNHQLVQILTSFSSSHCLAAFPGSFCSSWCWWVVSSAWYHFIRNFP